MTTNAVGEALDSLSKRKRNREDPSTIAENLFKKTKCCNARCVTGFSFPEVLEFRKKYNENSQNDQRATLLAEMLHWDNHFEFLERAVCKYEMCSRLLT